MDPDRFPRPTAAVSQPLVLRNFWHTTNGLYIWEFFTTLDYELDVLRGRRPYRWTIWIYSFTRVTTLVAVILSLIDLNTVTPLRLDCQAWITFELTFSYLGLAAASILIVFRIIAIWNKNKVTVAVAATVWVVNVLVMIQGIARLRSAWSPFWQGCAVLNTEGNKLNIIVSLITDIVLLLIMLVGLLRLRSEGGGRFGIGLLLWNQGLIWLLIATAAEVPPVVAGLNSMLMVTDPLNLMIQLPSLITMTIAATRMYRSLTDFVSSSGHTDIPQIREIKVWNAEQNCFAPNPPNQRIEVSVDTSYERFPVSLTSHDGTDCTMDRKEGRKSGNPSLGDDPERASGRENQFGR
ncbi:hypothetical protein BC827DRAFT_546237 [Russula dissimulans]|nr:hypothetical protein BC827DRAFT_546237 [Russula dissimulans]